LKGGEEEAEGLQRVKVAAAEVGEDEVEEVGEGSDCVACVFRGVQTQFEGREWRTAVK
jgi:hypothetical protein